jgi:hypothetical protein
MKTIDYIPTSKIERASGTNRCENSCHYIKYYGGKWSIQN